MLEARVDSLTVDSLTKAVKSLSDGVGSLSNTQGAIIRNLQISEKKLKSLQYLFGEDHEQ
jgi:arsenate reductase-like glutaredoxin family protein